MEPWKPEQIIRPEGCDFEYGLCQVPFLMLLQYLAWAAEAGWTLVQVVQGGPATEPPRTPLLLQRPVATRGDTPEAP